MLVTLTNTIFFETFVIAVNLVLVNLDSGPLGSYCTLQASVDFSLSVLYRIFAAV